MASMGYIGALPMIECGHKAIFISAAERLIISFGP
jgi:hypothetical protein